MHQLIVISVRLALLVAAIFGASAVFAQNCNDIFPGAVQNSASGGSVDLGWWSQILNTPNDEVVTQNLDVDPYYTTGCGGNPCTQTNSIADASDFTDFPWWWWTLPNIDPGWNQTRAVTPGDYNNLAMASSSTVNMAPGVYVFTGSFTMQSGATINVTGGGTATIFVQGNITLNNAATINSANGSRYVFLFSRGTINLGTSTTLNSVIYGYNDVTLGNGVTVTGAVTARGEVTLGSSSTIIYSSDAVSNTDFDDFCGGVYVPPSLVGEWRLDELSWNGTAGEVLDSSGNGLNGRAESQGGLPVTENTSPVAAGNPGTCRYGVFDGENDGHVQIDDPGTGSALDLNTFTVSVWIYARAYATNDRATIISKDTNFEFHLETSGTIRGWWGGENPAAYPNQWRHIYTTSPVPLNEWHHIAFTYESGSQFMYLDGAVAANSSWVTPAVQYNNLPLYIGRDYDHDYTRFDGYIDEVRLYDGVLSQAEVATVMVETHPCLSEVTLDHFDIDVSPGTGSTCSPAEITITAEDSSNNTLQDYTGTIQITTSTAHGTWGNTSDPGDAQGTLIPGAADSGAASYEFEASQLDEGSIALALSNTHAETLTITVEDSDAGVSSTSSAITFSENVFVVNSVDSLGDDLVAGRPHSFIVEMLRQDPVSGECGPASDYNENDVKVWLNRDSSDPGGTSPEATSASETETLPNAEPASVNFTLPFVGGSANFTLVASDVGRYSLQFLDDASGFSDSDIAGGSSTFVARPFAFDVQVAALPSPLPVDETGLAFRMAGEDFSATVRAVAWQSADDADDDGIADGHNDSDPANNAELSDNPALASYSLESPAEGVQLAAALVSPVGGNDPGLASSVANGTQLTGFTAGSANTSSLNYPEVGIIELSAQVLSGDYLGGGAAFSNRAQGRSGYAGRFTPAHFVVIGISTAPACNTGGFSYMGQPFQTSFTLDARNLANVLTQNYTGGFAKFDPDSSVGTISYGAVDGLLPTDLSARTTGSSAIVWTNGTGAMSGELTLARAALPDPESPYNNYSVGVNLADADGIGLRTADLDLDTDNDATADHLSLGSQSQYFGRLRMSDAFGPETANLPVVFVTEFWNGSIWQQNTLDECSLIERAAINYPAGSLLNDSNRSVAIGGASTTGEYSSIDATHIGFTAGDAGHFFSAPGAGNTGSFQVGIDLSLYPWLRFDWNNDGDFDNDTALPAATFTFGSYRGHDRVIYWQEVLQ